MRATSTNALVVSGGIAAAGTSNVMGNNTSLQDGVVATSSNYVANQPQMILVKTGTSASQVKKLGSNVEGPFQPSEHNMIKN